MKYKKKLILSIIFILLLSVLAAFFVSCNTAKVNVKFVINGEVYQIDQYTPGTTISAPKVTSYNGYDITGWMYNSSVIFFPQKASDVDMTFVADTTRLYTINFEADGVVVDSKSSKLGTRIELPEDPTKNGYRFDGWFFNGTKISTSYIVINAELFNNVYEVTYSAKFVKLCTINYIVDDYIEASYVVDEGSYLLMDNNLVAPDPKKYTDSTKSSEDKRYSFLCWTDSENNSLKDGTYIDRDIAYTATFEKKYYKVDYYLSNYFSSSLYATYYLDSTQTPMEIKVPDDVVYFGGWYTTAGLASTYNFSKALTSDTKLYAKVFYSKDEEARYATIKNSTLTLDFTYAVGRAKKVSSSDLNNNIFNYATNRLSTFKLNYSDGAFKIGDTKDGDYAVYGTLPKTPQTTSALNYSFKYNLTTGVASFVFGSSSDSTYTYANIRYNPYSYPTTNPSASGYVSSVVASNATRNIQSSNMSNYTNNYFYDMLEIMDNMVTKAVQTIDLKYWDQESAKKTNNGLSINTPTSEESFEILSTAIRINHDLDYEDYTIRVKVYRLKSNGNVGSVEYTVDGTKNISTIEIVSGLDANTHYNIEITYYYTCDGYNFSLTVLLAENVVTL